MSLSARTPTYDLIVATLWEVDDTGVMSQTKPRSHRSMPGIIGRRATAPRL
jgi:hypothetical protein